MYQVVVRVSEHLPLLFITLCLYVPLVGSRGHPLPNCNCINTSLFMAEEDNSVPGDWERYFSELSAFLTGAERQLGLALDSFSEYVVDRLRVMSLYLQWLNIFSCIQMKKLMSLVHGTPPI